MIADGELLQVLQFHRTRRGEAAADDKVIELLGNLRTATSSGTPACFAPSQTRRSSCASDPSAHRRLPGGHGQTRLAELMQKAPS
jgi:hypothetical protein